MTDEDLKRELITAYEMLRDQTKQVADLTILVSPLIRVLIDPKYDHLLLREAYERERARTNPEVHKLKDDSIAAVEDAIRRLKER